MPPQAAARLPSPFTVRGCLTGAAGAYVLLDKSSGVGYKLVAPDAELAKHIHHEIAVKGDPAAINNDSQASNSPQANSRDSQGGTRPPVHTLRVESLDEVADTCIPATGK